MKGARAHGLGGRRELRDVPTAAAAARLAGSGFRNWLRSVVPDLTALEADGACASSVDADRSAETPGAGEFPRGFRARAANARPPQPDADLAALCDRLDELSRRLGLTPQVARDPSNAEIPGQASQTAHEPLIGERDPDLSGLERQLKFLTTQLEILHSPCRADELVAELRRDVASIADALDNVVSRRAFQALQDEVRGLGARLEDTRTVDPAGAAFAGLERGLAELRAAVRGVAPVELDRAVQILSQKIDQISDAGPDPLIFRQLDNAIDALRSIVNQIASGDALSALGKEVRALGEKVDRATNAADFDPAALLDRAMEALEKQIAELGERLTARAAQSDHAAPRSIEERIQALDEDRSAASVTPKITGTAAAAPNASSLTPAAPDTHADSHPSQGQPSAPEASLPPEPALPRSRGKRNTVKRKLTLAPAPAESDRVGQPPARPNFIVAARRAAQAANDPQHQPIAASLSLSDLPEVGPKNRTFAEPGRTLLVSTSLVLVGLSAAGIAFLSADLFGSNREWLAERSTTTTVAEVVAPAIQLPELPAAGEIAPTPPDVPGSFASVTPPRETGPANSGGSPIKLATASSSEPDPLLNAAARSFKHPAPSAPGKEATGSIGSPRSGAPTTVPASPSTPASEADPKWTDTVPAAIATRRLLAGIADRNPGAAYEIALRYNDGRGVTADAAAAALWLARAAEGGLALAQFRLGCMYEKGVGVRKDLNEARRLYLAAAAKGHATAMHNIAVLYAEGIDGKPDLAAAVEWFRRAAEHGIVDSQYNLAVLHARGHGVERNLAESFKWFAAAAEQGDKDAGARRDEIAAQLEPPTLAAARLAAAAFSPKPQPEEATIAPTPPGGWDDSGGSAKATPGDQSE